MLCLAFSENSFKPVTKNLQKTKKSHFQKFRTFVFQMKVASKLFSKMLPMTKFGFTQF